MYLTIALLTRILVWPRMRCMAWVVELKAVRDRRPPLVREAGRTATLEGGPPRLEADPLVESRQMKTLRPNPVAGRELRLFGKYRVLFNVDGRRRLVTIVLVGEKRGEALIVQGEEFTGHHESDPAE